MNGDPARVDQRHVVLTTPRTALTTWLGADAEALFGLHSDVDAMRFVRNGRPETRHEVDELLGSYLTQQASHSWAKWRLADRDGQLIGRAGFSGTDDLRGLSYLIARPLWGQGLATEVASALVEWHLTYSTPARLQALVAFGNEASARVLEKVGFHEAGTQEFEGTSCRMYAYPAA